MQRHTSRGIMTRGKKTIFYIFVLLSLLISYSINIVFIISLEFAKK